MLIRFFATIREITREKEVVWDKPAPTLHDLLTDLCAHYGPGLEKWCLDGDELGPSIIILVNGRDARHQGGIRTPLSPGDAISIFPMVAGGR